MPRHLITSALPYINGVKHLGNMVGSLLPADVYSRYLRQRGHDVLFICATDEHGTPTELAAVERGMDVADFCTEQYAVHARLFQQFGLSFDHFGRTSRRQNHELTQHMASRLRDNGYLDERTLDQIYSIDDDRFLPDRYVVGTCPHCGYERARGDQCENCTRLLDPTDLIDARSTVSGSRNLELRPSRHLYLRLSALTNEVRAWVEKQTQWPILTSSIARKWLDTGLHDRSITRDLHWGVPVPWPGFESKVFYVWFDAPIGYIAATKEWSDAEPEHRDWRSWWYDADDVHYTQFMAKDNVPFHAVMFPATELGSGEPWKLVDDLKSFNWLTYYGGKFSTSQQRGIFVDAALDLLPADFWRYGLLANAPESDDTEFTWEGFAQLVNKDLAGIYGNFAHRTLKLTEARCGPAIPAGGEWQAEEENLAVAVDAALAEYVEHIEGLRYRQAAFALRTLWSQGNLYLDRVAPWHVHDPVRLACILRTAINLVRIDAVASAAFLPFTEEKVAAKLGLTAEERRWPGAATEELCRLQPGRPFTVGETLFPRVGGDKGGIPLWIEQMKQRFGGAGVAAAATPG